MGTIACKGYTDVFGKHGCWIGDVTGPKSYTQWSAPNTGGQVLLPSNVGGLRNIDMVVPIGISESGTYAVLAKVTSTKGASVASVILVWYPIATIGATQVTRATDLSGEYVRLLAIGG